MVEEQRSGSCAWSVLEKIYVGFLYLCCTIPIASTFIILTTVSFYAFSVRLNSLCELQNTTMIVYLPHCLLFLSIAGVVCVRVFRSEVKLLGLWRLHLIPPFMFCLVLGTMLVIQMPATIPGVILTTYLQAVKIRK